MSDGPSNSSAAFGHALRRILRPLVRAMIGRGVTFPILSEMLKALYVRVAQEDFRIEGKKVTDSRLSLLTGLQRRDVKALRERAEEPHDQASKEGAYTARVVARWLGDPAYVDATGAPLPLSRAADGGAFNFEALVNSVSQDMHPRTVLDELIRTAVVDYDRESKTVSLRVDAYTPSDNEADLMGYFGANLGDHAAAAVDNIDPGNTSAPYFERAVHYNQLSPESLKELDALARKLQTSALKSLNERAHALQQADKERPDSKGRFRSGAFIYHETEEDGEG